MKPILKLVLSCSLLTLASNFLAVSPAKADSLKEGSSSQPVNTYADYQLYCSQVAYYYSAQSPECNKYYPAKNTSVVGEERVGMDRQYEQYYLHQLEALNYNLKMVENSQNLEQLQRAQKSLSKTIEELEKIPADATIHSSVWQTIYEARTHLSNVDTWLGREYRARYQVLRAKVLSREAEKQTKGAVTLSDYKAVNAKWEEVQQLLSSVPLGVFAMEDVKSLQTFASVRQQNVIAQINILQAKGFVDREVTFQR